MAISPAQRHKLLIGGNEKAYLNIHFVKSHPNPDPDMFELRMCPEDAEGINYFDAVEVQKFNVTEFYGFVEEITPQVGEDGLEYFITGRCWKLIVWKKWTERFQESREIGPEDTEGNIESGFFGSVYPDELVKFIIRCPISVHPKYSIRHKIGWGIPSDFWSYCASETADTYYPDWVGLRITGLSWRCRGSEENLLYTELIVDSFDATYNDWVTAGSSPYLHTDNVDDRIVENGENEDEQMGYFTFTNLPANAVNVYDVNVIVKAKVSSDFEHNKVAVYLNDGVSDHKLGYLQQTAPFTYYENKFVVSGILDTIDKVNNAKIYFDCEVMEWFAETVVIYSYLELNYTTSSSENINQQEGDWFIVNLGQNYNDVTAILIECRKTPSMYARNYKIQYATISACCNEAENEDYWGDFSPAVNVINNTARDILHSWVPQDDVHCIRIMLTASANQAWEISQIYVWQADEKKYRILDEGD